MKTPARSTLALATVLTAMLAGAPAVAAPPPGQGTLPDGRAYEMVSPPDKNGGDIDSKYAYAATVDGRVLYFSYAAFGDAASNGKTNQYLAERAADRWVSTSVMPPLETDLIDYSNLSQPADDLSSVIVAGSELSQPDPAALNGTVNWFRRDSGTGRFQLASPRPNGNLDGYMDPVGWSSDLRHLAINNTGDGGAHGPQPPLVAGEPMPAVYEVDLQDDGTTHLRFASILPDGTHVAGATGGDNVVSADGSRAFFTAQPDSQIYMRLNGSSTVEISRTHRSPADPTPRPPHFIAADHMGKHVLFSSSERLTSDSNASGGGGEDLYLYDVDNGVLRDLSASAPGGGQTQGVVGYAGDFSSGYFVDQAVLATGASAGHENLYRWDGTTVRYLGALDPGDTSDWTPTPERYRQAKASRDGSNLVLTSRARLTSFDNASRAQIYVYNTQTGFSCASCTPLASHSGADAALQNNIYGDYGAVTNMTSDGARVFFFTPEALVPTDTNQREDVYSWDAETRRASLISSGHDASNSEFVGASTDGKDVYFTTREQLSGWDTDNAVDLYDAREAGGLPEPPVASPPCAGDSCQGGLAEAPPLATPATTLTGGAGNLTGARPTSKPKLAAVKLSADRRTVRGSAFRVIITVPAAGKLLASGQYLRPLSTRASRASKRMLTLRLTAAGTARLRRTHALTVMARVAFQPTTGRPSAATTAVTLKG